MSAIAWVHGRHASVGDIMSSQGVAVRIGAADASDVPYDFRVVGRQVVWLRRHAVRGADAVADAVARVRRLKQPLVLIDVCDGAAGRRCSPRRAVLQHRRKHR